jgi:hypothetical protein
MRPSIIIAWIIALAFFAGLIHKGHSAPISAQWSSIKILPTIIQSIDLFQALAMVESGDNDFARGEHREVSRYQILPRVWRSATDLPFSAATNPLTARAVAGIVITKRWNWFVARYNRKPTLFEWYYLWNCPRQVMHPSCVERERAQRFVNLCCKYQIDRY